MWELDYKESWAPKNWCFWTVVLEKTLESPLETGKHGTMQSIGSERVGHNWATELNWTDGQLQELSMDASGEGRPPHLGRQSVRSLRVWQSRILRPHAVHTCIPSPRTFFNPYTLYLRPWAVVVIVQCSVQFSSIQSSPTLYHPMDCSTPGFPVLHHCPELVPTHVHWVGDAIQLSHLLLSPSPPALNLFQH